MTQSHYPLLLGDDVLLDLPKGVAEVFAKAKSACLYNEDRKQRGLQTVRLPRDSAELHAHSASFLVEGLQNKRSAGARAPARAVPTGPSPTDHFEYGLEAESPLEAEPEYPDGLDYSVRVILREGENIDSWGMIQLQQFESLAAKCSEQQTILENSSFSKLQKHVVKRVIDGFAVGGFLYFLA